MDERQRVDLCQGGRGWAGVGLLLALGALIPLFIAGLWGDAYADVAYRQFQRARAIAGGGEVAFGGFSPLYTLGLALATRLSSLALPTVALVGSALGWTLAVVAWCWVGWACHRPTFSLAVTLLLALHPLQPGALGLACGLVLGLAGLTTGLMARERGAAMLVAMGLLVAARPAMFSFAAPLLACYLARERFPSVRARVAAALAVGAALYAPTCYLFDRCDGPCDRVFLLAAGQVLLAAAFAFLVPHLDWLVRSTPNKRTLLRAVATLSLLVLLLWQGDTLARDWRMRPTDRLALYKATGRWLRDHALPAETVGAQRAELLGYLAERPALALPASSGPRPDELLAAIKRTRPDYCVALNGLAWHGVRSQPWFRERYQQVYQVASPYDPATPLTLFRYVPSPFDAGEAVSVTVRFAPALEQSVPQKLEHKLDKLDKLELTGYRLDRQRLTPGLPLHLTLYWRASAAVREPLFLVVRLLDPATGQVWAQVEDLRPGGLRTDHWEAGMALVARYALVPPASLPPGDYVLDVACYDHGPGTGPPVPACAAETCTGNGELGGAWERKPVALARVYYPPSVDTAPPTPDRPLAWQFGGAIELVGYDAPHRVRPGETLRVALYWHALEPVSRDYKVFVHLFAPDGQLLAQDDSRPVQWSYPTPRWQAGEYIRDEHLLTLDPSAPRGDYTLSVGLYDGTTGERPAVRDAAGKEVAERRVILTTALPVR